MNIAIPVFLALSLLHLPFPHPANPTQRGANYRTICRYQTQAAQRTLRTKLAATPTPQYRQLSPEEMILMELQIIERSINSKLDQIERDHLWREYKRRHNRQQRLLLESITGYRIPPWLWDD